MLGPDPLGHARALEHHAEQAFRAGDRQDDPLDG